MEKFLKSRYRIGEKLGDGPFSITYKGYLLGTEVPIVIKTYKRAALNSPLINKLRPKVSKIVSLDHPNIARVIDGDYGWQGFYFVREFVDGEDLATIITRGPLGVEKSLSLIKQVLNSIAVAFENGLIHGAISTRNVFCPSLSEVKITDFILEPSVRANPSLLAEAAARDSSFMSPEQLKGEVITHASDVYSCGVVLYEMLTGRSPFAGSGGLDTALCHMVNDPDQPSHFNKEVPEWLDEVTLKMLEKDPLQRISTARDALESIEKERLVFRLPNQGIMDLIYDEDLEPIIYDEEQPHKKQKQKGTEKGGKRRKFNKTLMLFLFILIAIASGLWYAFFLNLASTR